MSSPSSSTTQRRVGRYLLQEELGRGGMGIVHAALDETLNRRVALKLLRPGGPVDEAVLAERFAREMQIAIALEHPNIVPVHETGTADGVRYIAMRLVDGEDLGAVLRRDGPLDPGRVARLSRQIAAALDAAHARGLVHRDVKPGNVLLVGRGDEEHAYLTDFGLTRETDGGLTGTGEWIGTVDYAAPEQIEAAAISPRTDVYAFGCMLYQALTGSLPFTGSFAAKATGHVSRPLPGIGPGVVADPSGIDAVLATATAKHPQERHASAGALARAFARAVAAASDDTGQQTVAMPLVVPDADGDGDEPATAVAARAPAVRLPATDVGPRRRPRAPAITPPLAPAPAAAAASSSDRRDTGSSRRPWAALAALAAVGALAAVLALGGGDERAGGDRSTTSAVTSGSSSAAGGTGTAAGATTPQPAAPAPAVIPTADYTAPAGGYTAQVPAGEGWAAQGERNLSGVLRSVFTGPDGQQLWIDATPTIAPAFGREGRNVTGTRRLDGPLGEIVGYRFSGVPTEFCAGGCVDYQVDLGGRGYAVIAGPTASARLAARTTMLSIRPADAAAPAAPAADPGQAAPAPGPADGKGKPRKDKGRDEGDD